MPGVGLALPVLAQHRRGGASFDFTGGTLPPGATLTRASAGMRHLPSGVLASVGANVARFDHDPVTHAPRGLLIEDARTNDLSYSDALQQAAWTKVAVSVAQDAMAAPDGTLSADVVIPSTSAGTHGLSRAVTLVGGTSYVVSGYFRSAGYAIVQLYGTVGYGSFYMNIDVAAGVETAFAAGNSIVGMRSVRRLDNGWCRVAVTLTALADGTFTFVLAHKDDPAAVRTAASTGDGTSGIAMWGMQHEAGASLSSYIATGTAAASRAADVLTLDWASRGVGDGAIGVRYTFDDGSTQDIATTVSGGRAGVPTDLARRWIARAEKI